MRILKRHSSSRFSRIGVRTMPVSTINDVGYLDSFDLINTHKEILAIATQPDFHVFTSLLWSRTSDVKTMANGDDTDSRDPNRLGDTSLPDLGMLRYHRDRMAASAEALQWRGIPALEDTEEGFDILRSSVYGYVKDLPELPADHVERRKVKIVINRAGRITVDSTLIDCLPTAEYKQTVANWLAKSLDLDSFDSTKSPIAEVYVDPSPSRASLFTTHKTSERSQYDAARSRTNVTPYAPTKKEVIVYNENSEIMEASLSTVYFFRNSQWVTPAVICGGNLGVTRRYALEKDLCTQGTIEVSDVKDGELIWLSNGARGFFVGRIELNSQRATKTG